MKNILQHFLWMKQYRTQKKVDFSIYLNKQDLRILRKFGIEIKDKKYTEYEFSLIDEIIFLYYRENNERNEKYNIEDIGVTQEEYDQILTKFMQISNDYEF